MSLTRNVRRILLILAVLAAALLPFTSVLSPAAAQEPTPSVGGDSGLQGERLSLTPSTALLASAQAGSTVPQASSLGDSAPAAPAPSWAMAGFNAFIPIVNRPLAPLRPQNGGFFAAPEIKNGSPDIVADGIGGLHLAYAHMVPVAQHPRAVYSFCSTETKDCANPANWASVTLPADRVNEVQLEVTPAGQPRMLIRAYPASGSTASHDYIYAACDTACTSAANWRSVPVVSNYNMALNQVHDYYAPQHSFAIDHLGRPRFVYLDNYYQTNHIGAYYATCDANCTTSAANWIINRISRANDATYFYEHFSYPSLAFTADGRPRLLAEIFMGESTSYIWYLECNANCGIEANWSRTSLYERGSTIVVSWDLEVSKSGVNYVTFYQGELLEPGGETLYIAWCSTNCTTGNWIGGDLGLGYRNGKHPDLQINANNQPSFAYMTGDGNGLGYAWCTVNCTTLDAEWFYKTVEPAAALDALFPIPRPPYCDAGLWTTQTPALALDINGQPRVAYDAIYNTRCTYEDPNNPNQPVVRYDELWHATREIMFAAQ